MPGLRTVVMPNGEPGAALRGFAEVLAGVASDTRSVRASRSGWMRRRRGAAAWIARRRAARTLCWMRVGVDDDVHVRSRGFGDRPCRPAGRRGSTEVAGRNTPACRRGRAVPCCVSPGSRCRRFVQLVERLIQDVSANRPAQLRRVRDFGGDVPSAVPAARRSLLTGHTAQHALVDRGHLGAVRATTTGPQPPRESDRQHRAPGRT